MENLENMFEAKLGTNGEKIARLCSFETIKKEGYDPYIRLEVKSNDGEYFYPCIFAGKSLVFFMENMQRQYKGMLAGMKLSEILKYMMSNDFNLWVEFDTVKNRYQYSWRKPTNEK